jgi:V/A-type H+-transporting ATPase subunit F
MAKYKTAVIGDLATTLPFRAMGIEAIVAEETEDLAIQFNKIAKSGEFGAIFITEEIADNIAEEIEKVRYLPLPSVILIPTVKGSSGKGKNAISETMKRAAGRDIMGPDR